MGATREEIRRRLTEEGVDYILAQYVDVHGTPRCKGVPVRAFDQFLDGSAGFAGGAVWGMGQGPHDHDLIAVPDLDSYTPVPWETGVARLACDITVDGQPWACCPRTILRRATEGLAREGYLLMVGVEAEHFLVTRRPDGTIAPFDPDGVDTMAKPCYDFKSLAGSMGYLRAVLGYLDALGWEPYASDHEDANAQYEINWKYADALTTADRYTFYKMLTSQVAKRFGANRTGRADLAAGSRTEHGGRRAHRPLPGEYRGRDPGGRDGGPSPAGRARGRVSRRHRARHRRRRARGRGPYRRPAEGSGLAVLSWPLSLASAGA